MSATNSSSTTKKDDDKQPVMPATPGRLMERRRRVRFQLFRFPSFIHTHRLFFKYHLLNNNLFDIYDIKAESLTSPVKKARVDAELPLDLNDISYPPTDAELNRYEAVEPQQLPKTFKRSAEDRYRLLFFVGLVSCCTHL
jgi:hypothetical protein